MLNTCLNCHQLASLVVPKELVEQQLGWKQDLPLKNKIAERHRLEDIQGGVVHICKDCCLNVVKLEIALANL